MRISSVKALQKNQNLTVLTLLAIYHDQIHNMCRFLIETGMDY